MTSMFDRFAQAAASRGRQLRTGVRPRKEFTRQIIKTTSWDDHDWKLNRKDRDIDKAITDLYLGDIQNPEDRPGYLNAPELVADVFMSLLKPVPMMHRPPEVKKDVRLNGKFITDLMKLPDYERLHDQTMTDDQMSRLATLVVIDSIRNMIQAHREQVKRANEERQKGGDRIPQDKLPPNNGGDQWDEESGEGQTQSSKGGGGEGNAQGAPSKGGGQKPGGHNEDEGKSQLDEHEPDAPSMDADPEGESAPAPWDSEEEAREDIKNQLDQAKQDGEGEDGEGDDGTGGKTGGEGEESEAEDGAAGGEGEGEDEEPTDDIEREFNDDYAELEFDDESDWEQMFNEVDFGRHVAGALEKAADDIQELDDLRRSVGIDDAEWKMMDPTQRMMIAERLNTPRMKQIADMVGRMKRFAMAKQQTKIIDAPHEVYSVEMGNDLRRVLRSELMPLGHPDTKVLFFKKFIDRELLQYKERGHEDVGKGPMIVCIDNSGSMGGAPENWAKGVAEAMRRVCADQGRDFHAIYFETNRHRERFDFPLGQGPFEKVLTFLSVSAGGGTEFDGVLTEALGKCQTMFDNEGKGKADIVFITDGEAGLNQDWIDKFVEERDRIGVRIFGIYISAYDSTRSSATRLLEKFCQVVVPVKALEVNDQASDTLFSVL